MIWGLSWNICSYSCGQETHRFYVTRMLISVSTKSRCWTLCWASRNKCIATCFNTTFPSLPVSFCVTFEPVASFILVTFALRVMCLTHCIIFNLIILKLSGEDYKLWSCSLCYCQHFLLTTCFSLRSVLHKMRGISWPAEELLASQCGLPFM
jgi:hypothetical protein